MAVEIARRNIPSSCRPTFVEMEKACKGASFSISAGAAGGAPVAGKAAPAPIIVIRKNKGHAGHHGGAWKVAYADFVTAMMAAVNRPVVAFQQCGSPKSGRRVAELSSTYCRCSVFNFTPCLFATLADQFVRPHFGWRSDARRRPRRLAR